MGATEAESTPYKIPRSVLVVVYAEDLSVLLLERADRPGYWQSVTGSQEQNETFRETAVRELMEETGLAASDYVLEDWGIKNEFEIFKHWRHRYAPGVTHNSEHTFGLMVPRCATIRISRREHTQYQWCGIEKAIDQVFSWTNAKALRFLYDNKQHIGNLNKAEG